MQSLYKRDFSWPTYLSSKESTHAETPELETAREGYKDPCDNERKRKQKTLEKKSAPTDTFKVPEYLEKLFQKYPHLHTFYQQAGEEQLMKKIEEEVYKTQYQIDFGKEGFVAKDDYDELIEVAEALREKRRRVCTAEVHGEEGKRLGENCTTNAEPCTCQDEEGAVKKLAMRPESITKMIRAPREPKEKEGADKESFKGKGTAPEKIADISEYKDSINRLGVIIIKQKLYHKKAEFTLPK